jgi:hypothetical protein
VRLECSCGEIQMISVWEHLHPDNGTHAQNAGQARVRFGIVGRLT